MLNTQQKDLIKAARAWARALRAEGELDGSAEGTRRALEVLKRAALALEFPTEISDPE